MGRLEKRIEKWRNPRFKQNVPVDDLYAVLDKYFPGTWNYGGARGSHIIRIYHQLLINQHGYGPAGDFTIPTTGGKHVRHFYLKNLVRAIDIIVEAGN